MKNIIKKINYLLWESDFENIDFWAGLNMIGWGVWLILPFQTFESSQVYSMVRSIGNEGTWGIIYVILGILRLITLFRDRSWERVIMIVVTTLFWTFMALSFLVSRPQAMVAYITSFLTIISLWETVRIIRKLRKRHEAKEIVKQI